MMPDEAPLHQTGTQDMHLCQDRVSIERHRVHTRCDTVEDAASSHQLPLPVSPAGPPRPVLMGATMCATDAATACALPDLHRVHAMSLVQRCWCKHAGQTLAPFSKGKCTSMAAARKGLINGCIATPPGCTRFREAHHSSYTRMP